ncbi:MAG: endopeptidase La [Erysipelotrichaceae bacterium]|nr:endopeptidase La [Erysipelotrichaceae bacterium]
MEDNTKIVLPAIAVRGVVPLPSNEFRIEVGRTNSVLALEAAEKMYGGNIILLVQKDATQADVTPDDIESIGVLAKITLKLKLPNNNYKVKFKVTNRLMVKEYTSLEPYFVCHYEKMFSILNGDDEETALLKNVATEVSKGGSTLLSSTDEVSKLLQSSTNADVLSDVIAYQLKLNSNLSKYRYLEEINVSKRLEMILEDIEHEKQIVEIENKINKDVKKSIDESQKEYYLREKMRAIQNELGDKARQEEDVDKLRKAIEEANLPKNVYDKAIQELQKYANTSNQMAEAGVIRSYLEWIVNLPWSKSSKDNDDLADVVKKLDANHYGLEKVKDRIIEYLAVKMMTGHNPSTILCFAGPPGVGKTSLARSISDALGRKFVKQSLGGVRDESEIRGHRRTYIGALPGRILKGMKDAGTVNPVFLLDEIDKMTADYRGDPAAAMLEVLDPEQNKFFSDNYLEEPYDLSQVMFITTANDLSNIPGPLRDRMEIIELSSYTEIEKFNIGFKHLLPRQLEEHGLQAEQLSVSEEAMYAIIQNYTREAGVRELNRMIAGICRKTVRKILMDKVSHIDVTPDNLTDFLGKIRFTNNKNRGQNQVGVVTGLAYTSFGGDTLDIEVTTYPGKGGLVLTGKLGDVMKESAQAAFSFVKSHCDEYNISKEFLEKNDIHIHVPEGAVPKDGPSAGVTLTTALVSALSNRPVDCHIGMTGEITLRGSVLPIGGLREKSIAAHRSGLTKIFIPQENERDIEDVPQEVRDVLEIIPVSHITEILNSVFN